MNLFIHQSTLKLIIFIAFLIPITSCKSSSSDHLKSYTVKELLLPNNEKLKVFIADTSLRQKKGLSKIKNEDFPSNAGMFFPGKRMYLRQFWMPETHFDLDVIFLNQGFYVLDIHRNLKHYTGKKRDRTNVPLSKEVLSQHVLEVKSKSKISKMIKPGMVLRWTEKSL